MNKKNSDVRKNIINLIATKSILIPFKLNLSTTVKFKVINLTSCASSQFSLPYSEF